MQHISYVEQLASGTLDPRIGGELHWLLPNPFIRLPDLRRMHAIGGLLQDTEQIHLRIGKGYEARFAEPPSGRPALTCVRRTAQRHSDTLDKTHTRRDG